MNNIDMNGGMREGKRCIEKMDSKFLTNTESEMLNDWIKEPNETKPLNSRSCVWQSLYEWEYNSSMLPNERTNEERKNSEQKETTAYLMCCTYGKYGPNH